MIITLLDENREEIRTIFVNNIEEANFYIASGQASYYEEVKNE